MLASWTQAGFAPDLFWRVTPRVFTASMQGAYQRRQVRDRDLITVAWLVEKYARSGKRMPALAKELKVLDQSELPEQSIEDMVEALQQIDNGRGIMDFRFIPHPA